MDTSKQTHDLKLPTRESKAELQRIAAIDSNFVQVQEMVDEHTMESITVLSVPDGGSYQVANKVLVKMLHEFPGYADVLKETDILKIRALIDTL